MKTRPSFVLRVRRMCEDPESIRKKRMRMRGVAHLAEISHSQTTQGKKNERDEKLIY